MRVQSLGWEDFLEEGLATHCRILAWRIPWTEQPGELQSMGSQRVWHDLSDWAHTARRQVLKMNHIFPHPSVSYKVAYIAIPDISHIWIWEKMWSVVFPGITINMFGNSNFCKIRVNIFRVYCCWLLILVSFFLFFFFGHAQWHVES